MSRSQGLDPQVLRPVRVLVLVDVEEPPAALVSFEDLGRIVEETDRFQEQVVEVQGRGRFQARGVPPEQARDLALAVGMCVGGDELGVEHLILSP